jgi:hypothetical protein
MDIRLGAAQVVVPTPPLGVSNVIKGSGLASDNFHMQWEFALTSRHCMNVKGNHEMQRLWWARACTLIMDGFGYGVYDLETTDNTGNTYISETSDLWVSFHFQDSTRAQPNSEGIDVRSVIGSDQYTSDCNKYMCGHRGKQDAAAGFIKGSPSLHDVHLTQAQVLREWEEQPICGPNYRQRTNVPAAHPRSGMWFRHVHGPGTCPLGTYRVGDPRPPDLPNAVVRTAYGPPDPQTGVAPSLDGDGSSIACLRPAGLGRGKRTRAAAHCSGLNYRQRCQMCRSRCVPCTNASWGQCAYTLMPRTRIEQVAEENEAVGHQLPGTCLAAAAVV